MNKIKISLFTIVIALCGFIIFIGGVNADTVSTSEEFLTKIADENVTEVVLESDITINSNTVDFLINGSDRVLDLNGYTLTINGEFRPSYYSSNDLSITDSGTDGKYISTARIYPVNYTNQDVSLIINNGTYIISSEYIFTDCGYFHLEINNGKFKASKALTAFNTAYASTITLNKLEFSARENSPYTEILLAYGKTKDISLGENSAIYYYDSLGNYSMKSLDDLNTPFDKEGTIKVLKKYTLSFNMTVQPQDPEREYYKFAGWYSDVDFNEEFIFGDVLTENKTIYAKWVSNITGIALGTTEGGRYSVNNNYEKINHSMNMTVDKDRMVTLKAYPDSDYKFIGFYEGVVGSSGFVEGHNDNLLSSDTVYNFKPSDISVVRAVFEKKPSIVDATVTGKTNKTYTGKAQTQNLTITLNGKKLILGRDYKISYSNNINAGNGTASFTIEGIGDYCGKRTIIFTINKANNPMTVSYKNKKVKYKKVKKKAQTVSAITVRNAKGNVEYSKISGNKKIIINKRTGKITVKKKTKKGTYKIKVKVNCKGTGNYKALVKTITLKIKVK